MDGSVFEYWASILRLRKTHKDIFIYGNFALLDDANDDVFAYTRTFEGRSMIVVTNFRKTAVKWSLPRVQLQTQCLVSNYGDIAVEDGVVSLRPFEAFATFIQDGSAAPQ